jgi:hypothetical protein
MSAVIKAFFALSDPLHLHPERAFLLAGLFAILFVVSLLRTRKFSPGRHLIQVVAVLVWILIGVLEGLGMANGWNIRVDLLVTLPLAFVMSLAAAFTGLRSFVARAPATRTPGREA